MTDPIIEAMCEAMRSAVISDDEGEFPRLFDLLDFSGENKAHTVTRGLAKAAYLAALPIITEEIIAVLPAPLGDYLDPLHGGFNAGVDESIQAIRTLAAVKVEELSRG